MAGVLEAVVDTIANKQDCKERHDDRHEVESRCWSTPAAWVILPLNFEHLDQCRSFLEESRVYLQRDWVLSGS